MTKSRKFFIGILIILTFLVGARIYLPYAVRDYVNRKLDELPDYDGRIGEVYISLLRGAYSIENIRIVKTDSKIPVPFFSASMADFSVQWKALFEGKIVAEIEVEEGRLNFVAGPDPKSTQTGIDSEWLDIIKDLFPLRINRFLVSNGEIHFRDYHSSPRVDVNLSDVRLEGKNLSNSRKPTPGRNGEIALTGRVEKSAPLKVNVQLEPSANTPTFNLTLNLKELQIKFLNDFLRAYAAIDAESGVLGVDIKMATADNRFKGLVKPIITDLKILSLKDDSSNPLILVWESFVGFWNEIFENQRHDQIGAEIPFSGSLENPDANIWKTIGSVFYNAFVEALKPGIKKKIDLDDLKD